MPGWSVRVDPFNALIRGRLGVELEVEVWKFISAELVPVFVVNKEPPAFNLTSIFSGDQGNLKQESNGWGPIAGTKLGLGFWLDGKPFEGYVIRAIYVHEPYTYKTFDSGGVVDTVPQTNRRLMAMFGSHAKWKWFTIAGGLGLGWELGQRGRCLTDPGPIVGTDDLERSDECDGLFIARNESVSQVIDLNSPLHPVVLEGRFSLGVVF